MEYNLIAYLNGISKTKNIFGFASAISLPNYYVLLAAKYNKLFVQWYKETLTVVRKRKRRNAYHLKISLIILNV